MRTLKNLTDVTIGNQQPSSEQEKVHRLFREEVLDNYEYINHKDGRKSYIIWEAPPSNVYVYALCSDENYNIKYYGLTNNPKTRLSHHYNSNRKSYVNNWIKSLKRKNQTLIMMILYSFTTFG